MEFEEWIDFIDEQRTSNYIDIFTAKNLIAECYRKYGREKKELSKEELNDLYEKWMGEDAYTIEKEEFMQILMDMYEDDHYPIKNCKECESKGKVCFEHDDGLSHAISHGLASPSQLRNSLGGPLRKSHTKFDKTIGGRAISSKESFFFQPNTARQSVLR